MIILTLLYYTVLLANIQELPCFPSSIQCTVSALSKPHQTVCVCVRARARDENNKWVGFRLHEHSGSVEMWQCVLQEGDLLLMYDIWNSVWIMIASRIDVIVYIFLALSYIMSSLWFRQRRFHVIITIVVIFMQYTCF